MTTSERAADRQAPLPPGEGRPAVVLLSGGLDSATTLAMAVAAGYAAHAVAFDYGQKHRAELEASARIAKALGAASFRLVHLDAGAFSGSALTDADLAVPEAPTEGIPITYVPARNTIFLAHALGLAEVLESTDLVLGVNAVDYSGYPDCRPAFIEAFEALANLATRAGVEGRRLSVHAPLIHMTKAEIVLAGTALGVDYAMTVSCYQADAEGRACGRCESCRLRRAGFEAAGSSDPTRYQT
ncbi:MAG TPA: 7-cyano-7-deazaguanine synthase QueC [Pseudomonadales bacterium]|nr:7-cyano-7-deazaguanine synthase QueC [Pseudomonadales bacterium]